VLTAVLPNMAKKNQKTAPIYCEYAGTRIDSELLPLARAAAALSDDVSTQEFISDAVNEVAARVLGREPIKRRPPPPRPHGKGRPRA